MDYVIQIDDETLGEIQSLVDATNHESIGDLMSTALGTYRSLYELIATKRSDESLGLYNSTSKSFLPVVVQSLSHLETDNDDPPPDDPGTRKSHLRLVK